MYDVCTVSYKSIQTYPILFKRYDEPNIPMSVDFINKLK